MPINELKKKTKTNLSLSIGHFSRHQDIQLMKKFFKNKLMDDDLLLWTESMNK